MEMCYSCNIEFMCDVCRVREGEGEGEEVRHYTLTRRRRWREE